MPGNKGRAAMVEDVDEEGNVKTESRRYAKSVISSGSPVKQQMNTGRKKSSKRYETTSPSESDSTEHASSSSRHRTQEKRSSRTSKGKEVVVDSKRPLIRSANTTPSTRNRHQDDPSYYGVVQHPASSARPRAATTRPQSYYGPTHPPLSSSAYYGGHPAAPPPNPMSYPAPQWMGPPPLGSSPLGTSPMTHQMDYFNRGPEGLASRFTRPEQRPRSAMGHRGASYGSGYDDYEAPPERHVTVNRKPSLTKRAAKESEDRRKMPPPSRPSTTQPRQILRPPPPQKSVLFDDDDLDGESELYRDEPRHSPIDFLVKEKKLPIRTRRPSVGPEYYEDQYALEPAASKSRRAENRRSSSYNFQDKVKSASQYQNEVTGGAPQALTPENLRRHKNGGSSRSTRSSASHDESSFRQSNTTRTTRSGSNDDDITIKVPNGAVVEVGNAKVNCTRGGEITIGRGGTGSERGTVYDDDLRSRAAKTERPVARTRASSQSVHSRRPRALPSPYAPDHGEHGPSYPYQSDYSQYIPPYPAYPQSRYGLDFDDDDEHYRP